MRLTVLNSSPSRSAARAAGSGLGVHDSPAERGAGEEIARALRRVVRGEVRFGAHDRMLYATDASLYQVEPLGVVVPADVADAQAAVRWCGQNGVAVLPRGGGTSLAGQCVNRAVVIDLSRHCRGIGPVDVPAARDGRGLPASIWAEPGVVVDELNRELLARGTGLFWAPDPATTAQATVGGCIGNNAAGARSIRYGRTSENLLALDVLLATGERVLLERHAGARDAVARRLAEGVLKIVTRNAGAIRDRFPRTVRRNAGYGLDMILDQVMRGATAGTLDLTPLLCGSEGTLAVTLGARLRLSPIPCARGLAVVSFAALEEAIEAVAPILRELLPLGLSAVELLDDVVLGAAAGNLEYRRYVELLPGADIARGEPKAALYVEFFGFEEGAPEVRRGLAALQDLAARLPGATAARSYTDAAAMLDAWQLRKAGEPLLHGLGGPRKPVTFIEDNAVPVERLGEFVRELKQIVARHGTRAAYWAHASVGVLHVRPMIDLHDPADRARMVEIAVEVADLARACGGVMSGEHGDGRVRGPLLERFFGPELMRAFREVKAVFDPAGLLNPGMVVAPGPVGTIASDLRVLAGPAPAPPAGDAGTRPGPAADTFFDFGAHGPLGAAELCNGAGVCRKTRGGTMCPSYRATLDERHATRGRGNALRLAIGGQLGPDRAEAPAGPAWDDPETVATLNLCLSCKACKAECPSNVDIARLKAEYLAQRNRLRGGPPLADRAFGHVRRLNRLGSLAPGLANWGARRGPVRWALRRALGIDPRRTLPPFAPSLYAWMHRHRAQRPAPGAPRPRRRVGLFADCFTTYNEPGIGAATVRALEALGCEVVLLPEREGGPLRRGGCCGRALISTGLLPEAIAEADATIGLLRPALEDDALDALVVCEPSCLSAITDDWLGLRMGTPLEVRRALAAKAMLPEQLVAELVKEAGAPAPGPPGPADPATAGRLILHAHCHQKALWGASSSAEALRLLAPGRVDVLDSGCCGLAGAFGFTADRYDLSMRVGELSLFGSARAAGPLDVLVAPGTSCRHQIHDGTGRRALHPMEVIGGLLAAPGAAGVPAPPRPVTAPATPAD